MPIYSNYPTGSHILYGGRTESPRKGFKFKKYPSWGTIAKSKTDPNLIYVFEPHLGKEFWEGQDIPQETLDSLAFQRDNGSWVRYDWNQKTNSFETIDVEEDSETGKKQLSIETSGASGSKIEKFKVSAIKESIFEKLKTELDGIINLTEGLTDKINTDEILNFSPDSLTWWIKDILHSGQPNLNVLNDLSTIKQDMIDAKSSLDQINDKVLESLAPLGLKGVDINGNLSVEDYVAIDSIATNIREDIEALNTKWDSIDSAGMQTIIDKLENYQSPIKTGNTLGDDLKNIETIYDILADATSGGPIGDRLDNITLNYEEITQNVGLNIDQSFTSIPDIGDGTLASISETLSYMSTNLIDKNDEKLVHINSSGKLIKETNTSLRYDDYYQELVYVDETGNNTFIYLQGKKTQMQLTEGGGISTLTYLDEDEIPQSTQHIIKGQLTELSFDEVNNRLVFIDENGHEKYVVIPDGVKDVTTDLSYSDAGEPVWDSFLEEWDLGDPAKLVYTNERDSAFDITIEERDNLYIYTPEDDTYWPADLEDTMDGTPVWIGEDIATHLFRLDYIPFYRNSALNEIHGYPSNDVDAEFWFPKLPGGYEKFSQSDGGTVVQKGSYKSDYEYFYDPGAGEDEETYTLTRGSWQEFISNDPAFRRVDSYGSPAKFDFFSNSRLNDAESASIPSRYLDLDNLLLTENPLTKYLVYIDEDKIPNAVSCGQDNLTTMYTELPQNIEELYPGIDLVDATPSEKSLHYIDERYLDGSQITKITLPPDKITSLTETDGDLLLVHEGLDSAGLASEDDWLRIHSNVKDYDENRTYNPGEMAYFDLDNQGITSLSKNEDVGLNKVVKILSQNNEWKNVYGDFLESVESIKSENDQFDRISYYVGDFTFRKNLNVDPQPEYPFRLKNDLEISELKRLYSQKLELNFKNSKIEITPEIEDPVAYEGNIKLQTNAIDSELQYPRKEDWKEYSPDQFGGVQTIDLFYRNHFIYVDNVSTHPAHNDRFVAKLDDGLYKGQEIRLWLCVDKSLDSAAEFVKFKVEDEIFEYDDTYLESAANDSSGEVRKYQHVYEVDKKYTPPVGYSANMTRNFQRTGNISVEKYRKKIKSRYVWNKGASDTDNIQGNDIGTFLKNLPGNRIDSPGTKIIYDEIVSVEGTGLTLNPLLENVVNSFEKGNEFLTDVNVIKPVSSVSNPFNLDLYTLKTKEIGKPLIIVKNAKYKSIKTSGEPDSKYFQEFPIREDYQYIMAEPEIVKFKVTSTIAWQEEDFESNSGVWTGDYWWLHEYNYYYEYLWPEDLWQISRLNSTNYLRKLGSVEGSLAKRSNRKSWKKQKTADDSTPNNDELFFPVPSLLNFGDSANPDYRERVTTNRDYYNGQKDPDKFYIHPLTGPTYIWSNREYPNRPTGLGNLAAEYRSSAEFFGYKKLYYNLWNRHYYLRSVQGSHVDDGIRDAYKNSGIVLAPDSYNLKKEHFVHSKQINHMTHEEAHKPISHEDIDSGYIFLDKRISNHGMTNAQKVTEGVMDVEIDDNVGINKSLASSIISDEQFLNSYLHEPLSEVYVEETNGEKSYGFRDDAILFHLDDNDNIISINKPKFNENNDSLNIEDFKDDLRTGDSLVLHYPKRVVTRNYLQYKTYRHYSAMGFENFYDLIGNKKLYTFNKVNERYRQSFLGISLSNFYRATNLTPQGTVASYITRDVTGTPTSENIEIQNELYLEVESEMTESSSVAYHGPAQKFQHTVKSNDVVNPPTHDQYTDPPATDYPHPFYGTETDNHNFTYTDIDITQLNAEKPFYRFPDFLDVAGSSVYSFKNMSELLKVEGLLTSVTHVVNPIATISIQDNLDLDAWNELHRPGHFIFNDDDKMLGTKNQTVELVSNSNVHWGLFEFENTGEWDIDEQKISECYYLGIPKPKYIDSSPLMYRCIWNGTHWILLDGSCDEDFGFETPADIWD